MSPLRSRRLMLAAAICLTLTTCFYAITKLLVFARLFGSLGQKHSGAPITQREISVAHGVVKHHGPAPVPKILHQIYHSWDGSHNETLPSDWAANRQTCVALNPSWEHMLWTAETSRNFIQEQFSWFLSTYDAYQFPLQKVDALRYFLLRHYGGIYLDLDNGCSDALDALTYYPAFTTDAGRGSLGSSIMGGQPNHPWFQLLTENLIPWNWNWVFHYVIINYCTGKWYATAMWERYHSLLSDNGLLQGFHGFHWGPMHRVLMDPRLEDDTWVYFTQERGGTWQNHNWDNHTAVWVSHNVGVVITGVFAVAVLLSYCCVRYLMRRKSRGYREVARA